MLQQKTLCTSLVNCFYTLSEKCFDILGTIPFCCSNPVETHRQIFCVEANVRKYWDHSLYLSILKHNCDRSSKKRANTQAYQFLLSSQPLCKMEKHGHHHVHVYMPALFGDANRTPQIRLIIFSRLTVSSKSHNEHHAVTLIGV